MTEPFVAEYKRMFNKPCWAGPCWGSIGHDWLDCPECLARYDAWVNAPDDAEEED